MIAFDLSPMQFLFELRTGERKLTVIVHLIASQTSMSRSFAAGKIVFTLSLPVLNFIFAAFCLFICDSLKSNLQALRRVFSFLQTSIHSEGRSRSVELILGTNASIDRLLNYFICNAIRIIDAITLIDFCEKAKPRGKKSFSWENVYEGNSNRKKSTFFSDRSSLSLWLNSEQTFDEKRSEIYPRDSISSRTAEAGGKCWFCCCRFRYKMHMLPR